MRDPFQLRIGSLWLNAS